MKDVIAGFDGVCGVVTVTVAVAVTVPNLFVAVRVYVVVCVGWTSRVPANGTCPTVGAMLTLSAFSTCQTKVDVLPDTMLKGPAEKRIMRGAVPGVTETPTLQVSEVLVAVLLAVIV